MQALEQGTTGEVQQEALDDKPWWAYGYVWLILAGPTAVIAAGAVTVVLAASAPDPPSPRTKEPKHLPEGLGFLRVDFEARVDTRAARLGGIGPIAERRSRAVPAALFRIFDHGTRDVPGGLLAL